MRISRPLKRLRRWCSQAFRKRHSPAAFRTCRNGGNRVLTADGTTSKRTGSISCEVEFCIFYRLSLRTLRTNYVHGDNAVRQTEMHTAEPLVPEPSALEIDINFFLFRIRRNCPRSGRSRLLYPSTRRAIKRN